MNDEIFRLSLIDVMNEGLLNNFVNDIFGYDFDIKKEEYVYTSPSPAPCSLLDRDLSTI